MGKEHYPAEPAGEADDVGAGLAAHVEYARLARAQAHRAAGQAELLRRESHRAQERLEETRQGLLLARERYDAWALRQAAVLRG